MNWREETTGKAYIRDVEAHLQEGECVLRWHWPQELPCVYVHRASAGVPFHRETPVLAQAKLYTREEYKANGGYRERLNGVGQFVYRIFPCVLEEGKPLMLVPPDDGKNLIRVSTGKAIIRYAIKRKAGWFSKFQHVQIQITTEIPLDKDVLCYVKKTGGYPQHKDDGIQYEFLNDFQPGRNLLPEIRIGKDDYLRLFFTDGRIYGEIYELIPE